MITRSDVLREAIIRCTKELYENAQPHVEWEDFVKQNKEWTEGSPKPFEFYYLPEKVFRDIVDSYVHAYKIESSLGAHIDLLLGYFLDPIIDTYVKKDDSPGYRGYEHIKPLGDLIGADNLAYVYDYANKAREFYSYNADLNNFNISIYLGATPNSNKEAVIQNWKKYRNTDIVIDDSAYDENLDDDD